MYVNRNSNCLTVNIINIALCGDIFLKVTVMQRYYKIISKRGFKKSIFVLEIIQAMHDGTWPDDNKNLMVCFKKKVFISFWRVFQIVINKGINRL